MSQMGGWAVLDYALRYDPEPADNLRLGYASMLSSWALLNSGDTASNFGYWTPGQAHDGAMSWGFQPRQTGSEWNPATQELPRGAWPVCGEADHGLVAGIEAACTVLFEDPLFGLTAYGGTINLQQNEPHRCIETSPKVPATSHDPDSRDGIVMQPWGELLVTPRDGVRQRFYAVLGGHRIRLTLDRDGFAANHPVRIARDLHAIAFTLESRAPQEHETVMTLEGLPPGEYSATLGTTVTTFHTQPDQPVKLSLRHNSADQPQVRLQYVAR